MTREFMRVNDLDKAVEWFLNSRTATPADLWHAATQHRSGPPAALTVKPETDKPGGWGAGLPPRNDSGPEKGRQAWVLIRLWLGQV